MAGNNGTGGRNPGDPDLHGALDEARVVAGETDGWSRDVDHTEETRPEPPLSHDVPHHVAAVRAVLKDALRARRAPAPQQSAGAMTNPHGISGEIVNDAVDKLNELLRGELSAVETYDLALRSVRDRELSGALRRLRDSHDHRVTLLCDRVRRLGAEPAAGSGAWGAFAKVVQRGADLLGDAAATSALENGEEHGTRLYSEGLEGLDEDTRGFITSLRPEQNQTRELCQSLRRFVRAA